MNDKLMREFDAARKAVSARCAELHDKEFDLMIQDMSDTHYNNLDLVRGTLSSLDRLSASFEKYLSSLNKLSASFVEAQKEIPAQVLSSMKELSSIVEMLKTVSETDIDPSSLAKAEEKISRAIVSIAICKEANKSINDLDELKTLKLIDPMFSAELLRKLVALKNEVSIQNETRIHKDPRDNLDVIHEPIHVLVGKHIVESNIRDLADQFKISPQDKANLLKKTSEVPNKFESKEQMVEFAKLLDSTLKQLKECHRAYKNDSGYKQDPNAQGKPGESPKRF